MRKELNDLIRAALTASIAARVLVEATERVVQSEANEGSPAPGKLTVVEKPKDKSDLTN